MFTDSTILPGLEGILQEETQAGATPMKPQLWSTQKHQGKVTHPSVERPSVGLPPMFQILHREAVNYIPPHHVPRAL